MGVGPSNASGLFVFGSEVELVKMDGVGQSPFRFSSSLNPKSNPNSVEKEKVISMPASYCDGRQGKVGNILQREGDSSGRRDHSMDKARPNIGVGKV